MRRFGVIVALSAVLGMFGGVLTAAPALAGRGPKWEIVPAAPFTLDPSFCGFAVLVNPVAAKEFQKELKAPDGTTVFLITGTLKVSYTNLQTGKTITENSSGPGTLTTFPDGSATEVDRGGTVAIFAPADAARFGLPTASITTGRLTVTVDANGNLTSVTLHGHVKVNICAALS